MASAIMTGFRYRPEIDGLRAVAVIPVILFHMGMKWIPGGFLGVDVFFVISGFLITSIIKTDLDEGNFSLRDFWARRIRRILPAMLVVTTATLAVSYAFVYRPDQQLIGKQALAALFSVANIYFWRSTGDYWGNAAEESPFLHAWSLSVEEQFYLVFPIAMWLIFKFRSQWLMGSLLGASLISFVFFVAGLSYYPTATFYLMPTRIWELGTGSLLALALQHRASNNPSFGVFSLAGLGLITVSYFSVDTLSIGLALTVFGTALIIAFGQTGVCFKVLSQPQVVHVGKISYSLYLWHWPVLVLAKPLGIDWPGVTDKALLALVIYILALGTYHLVEKPTRRRNDIIPYIVATAIALAGIAFIMPSQYEIKDFNTPTYFQNYYCLNPLKNKQEFNERHPTLHNPMPEDDIQNAFLSGGIIIGPQQGSPKIVVLGDSLGVMWSNTIRDIAENLDIQACFYSASGAPPFVKLPLNETESRANGFPTSSKRLQYDRARLKCIEEWQPALVILCTAWSRRTTEEAIDLMNFLEKHAGTVLLLEQPPLVLEVGRKDLLQYLIWKGVEPKKETKLYWPSGAWDYDDVDAGRKVMKKLAAKYENCEIVEINDIYRRGNKTLVLDGFDIVYMDFLHLSEYGAQLSSDRLDQAIRRVFSIR